MSKLIISVVIPLYNKSGTVARTIQSVLNQSRLPDAIIVVDDGSSDGSAGICKAILEKAPIEITCQLVEQANAGVSVARNVGVESFEGDIVAFIDADDEWLPNHLEEIEALALAVPDAGILSTRSARHAQPSAEPSSLPLGFFGRVSNGLATYRQGYGVLHTSAIAVTREAFTRSGGFPAGARKSQDIHLWLRLLVSNSFAHSDKSTTIRHEEASGVALRRGVVPEHFSYFLGTEEGRKFLSEPEMIKFLASNLIRHVAGHRLRYDDGVVLELNKLASSLPLIDQFKSRAISLLPRKVIAWIVNR